MTETTQSPQLATLAGGCFWCTEAVFKRLKGVLSVESGYCGGVLQDPSYEEVSYGHTGHAEAVQITFDPSVITFEQLLEVFWKVHDPTTKDRQGVDVGSEYRSIIFYHDEEQKKIAEESKRQLDASKMYPDPAVTEIVPFTSFYRAEEEHQDFYNSGQRPDYCRLVIDPKIQKLYKEFKPLVKEDV